MVSFLSQFLFFFLFSVSNALLRAVQGVPFITLWILKAWRFRVGIIQFITRLENARVINFRMHRNKNVTFILHGVGENQIYETLERGNKNLKDSSSAGRREKKCRSRTIYTFVNMHKQIFSEYEKWRKCLAHFRNAIGFFFLYFQFLFFRFALLW